MGRLNPKWTQEQAEAIGHAMVSIGMSAHEATTAAAKGDLAGLPAFDMPENTARECARNYRQMHNPQQLQPGTIDHDIARIELVVSKIVHDLADKAEANPEQFDVTDLRKAARLTEELEKLRRGIQARAKHDRPRTPTPQPSPNVSTLLGQLANQPNTNPPNDQPNPPQEATSTSA